MDGIKKVINVSNNNRNVTYKHISGNKNMIEKN